MTPDIIAALEAFAAYADPRRSVPASMPVTSGSSMARKQLTMGDCYAAADALAALSTSPAGQEVRDSEIDQAKSEGMDQAADFCIQTLAKALGVDDWQQADGSETWDGDVAGTIYNVLKAGRVYDDEDGRVARLEDASAEPAGNGREAGYAKVARADLIAEASKLPDDFPNYGDWAVTLPAGHWRAIMTALSSPPAAEQEVVAKPWYEVDAHRDLSRLIPDMEGKIADAKKRYAHCLPDHLFAPLEASISELKVLRHEVAGLPTSTERGR